MTISNRWTWADSSSEAGGSGDGGESGTLRITLDRD